MSLWNTETVEEEENRKKRIRKNMYVKYHEEKDVYFNSWYDTRVIKLKGINPEAYQKFLRWASNEITHFEYVGFMHGVEMVENALKGIGLYNLAEKMGYNRELVMANQPFVTNKSDIQFAIRENEHYGYYEANLNTLLRESGLVEEVELEEEIMTEEEYYNTEFNDWI